MTLQEGIRWNQRKQQSVFTRIYVQPNAYIHDRMCMRACVYVNTFVELSPFACPPCKYTHVELTSVHMRDACERVP